jgi:hypothetical protein
MIRPKIIGRTAPAEFAIILGIRNIAQIGGKLAITIANLKAPLKIELRLKKKKLENWKGSHVKENGNRDGKS